MSLLFSGTIGVRVYHVELPGASYNASWFGNPDHRLGKYFSKERKDFAPYSKNTRK